MQELLDTGVGLRGVVQGGLGELQHRPVVRAAKVVAQLRRTHPLQHGGDRQHIAERLAHLLPAHGDPAVVQPEIRKAVTGGTGLGYLILVMWKHQICSTAVNIELRAEVLVRHGHAFGMPTGAAAAPRCRPRRLTGFSALPEGEVALVPLAGAHSLALVNIVDPVPGEPAVVGDTPYVEVDVTRPGVGVTGVDEA